jgi:acetyl esterase/lipase
MRLLVFLLIGIGLSTQLFAQEIIPLYTDSIPNARPCSEQQKETMHDKILIVEKVTVPTLTVFLPEKNKSNGTAVLICPGGGYAVLAAGHEGADIAKLFTENGVAAFVLRYRLPNDNCMSNKMFVPLMDAQQSLYLIKQHAGEWNIDTSKIGIMGFSAGGHLASTVGTHWQAVLPSLHGIELRPAFMILGYPVISFRDSITHVGSRTNLIGEHPDEKWIHYFSNEEQVTPRTPPAFMVLASNDKAVIPANSILFYNALLKNNVPAEMHIYQAGGHGFGLNNSSTQDKWFNSCLNWMRTNKWL